MTTFAPCPNCGAEYPDFTSLRGTLETLCLACGWASDEEADRLWGDWEALTGRRRPAESVREGLTPDERVMADTAASVQAAICNYAPSCGLPVAALCLCTRHLITVHNDALTVPSLPGGEGDG